MKMKWFKYLIYFGQYAWALLYSLSGIKIMTGFNYDALYGGFFGSGFFYNYFGKLLRYLDLSYGILTILLAVFAVGVRFALAEYQQEAPKMLIGQFAVSAVVDILYRIIADNIMNTVDVMTAALVAFRILFTTVLILCNIRYFKKRELLFMN